MIPQPIINIAEIFARKKVTEVVISPGSRSAPLTIAFARHAAINTRVIPDERSAAFIALGMATASQLPVGLVCTSGSAALNYYPAIAEAYFQHIPLIILTADRPKEWLGQRDGQTIFQNDIYKNHIKKSYELPAHFAHRDALWYTERIVSEAINLAMALPRGPVHINIPLREPLYPSNNERIEFSSDLKIISTVESVSTINDEHLRAFDRQLRAFDKVLVVVGQQVWTEESINHIEEFIQTTQVTIIGDVVSNLHTIDRCINTVDTFLTIKDDDTLNNLKPELLITFANSVISKNLKTFLRKYRPKEHWHIQEAGDYADTYQTLTQVIRCNPIYFIQKLAYQTPESVLNINKRENYFSLWSNLNNTSLQNLSSFFQNKPFTEFEAVKIFVGSLPQDTILHLSNSMPVRYVNYLGLKGKNKVTVYCNRGTSGIDGCSSTAVGASFIEKGLVVLLTGDMAFFYDRNAFWHNYPMANLRIVILNNHAGGIFGLIDGPADLPEKEEFFETTQSLKAENTANDFNMHYYFCRTKEELEKRLPSFYEPSSKAKILEIETNKNINREVFLLFKAKQWESKTYN